MQHFLHAKSDDCTCGMVDRVDARIGRRTDNDIGAIGDQPTHDCLAESAGAARDKKRVAFDQHGDGRCREVGVDDVTAGRPAGRVGTWDSP